MSRTTVIILIVATLACQSYSAAGARQPNLILIMADDLGYETLGCNGGESYSTPHLDRLAATGMRFERCYVQPLCTPTRVQLMTGMYNVRNYSAWATIDPRSETFAKLLKEGGYATAIAGKWQLGRDRDLPQRLGFDKACLWQHTRRPPRYANPGLEYNGRERDFEHGEYGPDLVSDFALEFIAKHKSGPFLLYYPMMLTHAPFQPTPDSPDWDPRSRGEKSANDVTHFAEMVAYMDKLVGKLVSKLDELGIRDDTLVLFLGDNGTAHGVTSRFDGGEYQGGKGSTTERGMHVPLIANWPGHVPPGRVNGDLIDSTDFLPTLCKAAGVTAGDSAAIDGRSFLPQLLGKPAQPREWIYCWFSMHGGPRAKEFVMNKTHKLYRNGKFYALSDDPFEEHPRRVESLTAEQAKTARMLQSVLDRYASARPTELLASKSKAKNANRGQKARKQRKAARRGQ
jgi:arylsulfatase A